MRRTHLGVQAAIVLTMVALVSWPQYRPVRAQSVWRFVPQTVLEARTNDAARFAGQPVRRQVRVDQTAFTANPVTTTSNATAYASTAAPAPVTTLGGKVNALVGHARTSLNAPIPYARVVLRNVRTGRLISEATADADGAFQFLDLDANAYIVELVGADGGVVATSTMTTVARGEVRQTEVRVAAASAAVRVAVGNTLTPTAPQATTVASSNDVTRTTTTQATTASAPTGTATR
jgi:hypothetical protein